MSVQAIKNLIIQAKEQESVTRVLHRLINDRLPLLHPSIALPEENAGESLEQFTIHYIDLIPELIETLYAVSKDRRIAHFLQPFLHIIDENFISSTKQNNPLSGLDVLLNKAYFTHRLIEELNDWYLLKTGAGLIPLEITWANLIIHSIIGEHFANELDTIVDKTIEQKVSSQKNHTPILVNPSTNQQNPEKWLKVWSSWNNLSKNTGIDLKLTPAA